MDFKIAYASSKMTPAPELASREALEFILAKMGMTMWLDEFIEHLSNPIYDSHLVAAIDEHDKIAACVFYQDIDMPRVHLAHFFASRTFIHHAQWNDLHALLNPPGTFAVGWTPIGNIRANHFLDMLGIERTCRTVRTMMGHIERKWCSDDVPRFVERFLDKRDLLRDCSRHRRNTLRNRR